MPAKPDQAPMPLTPVDADLARSTARRRFARAGLAAPVVLSSLISKPALGTGVPYICTVSGKLSGNMSHPGATENCTVLGNNCQYWRTTSTWYGGFVKGALPQASGSSGVTAQSSSSGQDLTGTPFSTPFLNAFAYDGEKVVVRSEAPAAPSATMLQVLHTTKTTPKYELGREAVAALLNAHAKAGKYPLTPQQVVAMFNEVWQTGSYKPKPNVTWSRAQVISYLKSLHPS